MVEVKKISDDEINTKTKLLFDQAGNELNKMFPRSLRIDARIEYLGNPINDPETRKYFKVGRVPNALENTEHFFAIIPDLGQEYKDISSLFNEPTISNGLYGCEIYQGNVHQVEQFSCQNLPFSGHLYLFTNQSEIEYQEIRGYFKRIGWKVIIRDSEYFANQWELKQPDFFVCHDSNDKQEVEKLANALTNKFVKVWFDKYSLQCGDSLAEKINEGLINCKKAIVVISKNFIANKSWAKAEIQSLKAIQINKDQKKILPIWLDITKEDLLDFDPWLLDKVALNFDQGIDSLIIDLMKITKAENN